MGQCNIPAKYIPQYSTVSSSNTMAVSKKAPGKAVKSSMSQSGAKNALSQKAKRTKREIKKNMKINFMPYIRKSSSTQDFRMKYSARLVVSHLMDNVVENLTVLKRSLGLQPFKSRTTVKQLMTVTKIVTRGELSKHATVEGMKSCAKLTASY